VSPRKFVITYFGPPSL